MEAFYMFKHFLGEQKRKGINFSIRRIKIRKIGLFKKLFSPAMSIYLFILVVLKFELINSA
jgi:hypothetical protein